MCDRCHRRYWQNNEVGGVLDVLIGVLDVLNGVLDVQECEPRCMNTHG